MATLTINGKAVTVDGSFAQLSSADQEKTVNEIAAQMGKMPAPPQGASPAAAPSAGGYDATPVAQGLSGVNEGLANTLGAPVDLVNLGLRGAAAAVHAFGGPDVELPVDAIGGSQSIKSVMGGAIKPEGTDPTGQFVRRVGQEVGAAAVPVLGPAGRSASAAADIARGAAAAVTSGLGAATAEQIAPGNPYLDMAGEILGGGLMAGGMKGLQKIVSPAGEIAPARLAAASTMKNAGVDLTAGQVTGNKGLQYAESELGGSSAQQFTEKQAQQFTQAALAKAGVSAQKATPPVMDRAFSDIGARFDTLEAKNTLVPDQQMFDDLHSVWQDYDSLVPDSHKASIVRNTLNDIGKGYQAAIANSAPNSMPEISGAAYQAIRSNLRRLARKTSNPETKDALNGLGSSLDAAMERSIAENNPSDVGEFQQARNDYRNLLVVENAVGKAGEATNNGIITPANLAAAAKTIQGKRAYIRGQGDFADLAHAGNSTMTPLPNSGTSPRAAMHAVPAVVGTALGALAGGGIGAPLGTLAGLTAPRVVGEMMLSGIGRKYLTNQAWTGSQRLRRALVGPAVASLTRMTSQASTPSPATTGDQGGPDDIPRVTIGPSPAPTVH